MKVVVDFFVLRMDLGKHVRSTQLTAVRRDHPGIGKIRRNRLECRVRGRPIQLTSCTTRPRPDIVAHQRRTTTGTNFERQHPV